MSNNQNFLGDLAQGNYVRQFNNANLPVNPQSGQKRGGLSRFLQTAATILGSEDLFGGVSQAINNNNMGNIYEYNRQEAIKQAQAQAMTEQMRRQQFGSAMHQAYPNQLPNTESYITPAEVSSLFPAYQAQDLGKGLDNLSAGGNFQSLGSAPSDIQHKIFESYSKQLTDNTNFNAANDSIPSLYGKGGRQQTGILSNAQTVTGNPPQQTPSALADGNPYGIDPNDPTIKARISYDKPLSYMEAMRLPTVPYQDVNQAYNNSGTLAENTRHNQVGEGIDQFKADTGRMEHNATVNNLGGYARYAPAGPAPNEAYYKNQYVQSGQMTPQEAFGGGGQGGMSVSQQTGAMDAINKQMYQEGLVDENGRPTAAVTGGGGFMGIGGQQADPAKVSRYQQLSQAKNKYFNNITGTGNNAVQAQKSTGRQAGADLQTLRQKYNY